MRENDMKVFSIALALILIVSLFTAVGVTSYGTDESVYAMVSIREMYDVSLLRESGASVLYRYPDYALVRIGMNQAEKLQSTGMEIHYIRDRTVISVKGHEFDFRQGMPDFPEDLTVEGYDAGTKGVYLVHMLGPVAPSWRQTLVDMGVEILDYTPSFTYEVVMTPDMAKEVEKLNFVDWVGIYQPGFKLGQDLRPGMVNIRMVDGSKILTEIMDETSFVELARMPDVYFISNYIEPKIHDEIASQIIGGGVWVWDPDDDPYEPWRGYSNEFDYGAHVNHLGYSGEGIIVTVADTGIRPTHHDFQDRVIGGRSWDGGGWDDIHGHGTHCAGSVAGDTYRGTQLLINEMWSPTHEDMGDFYAAQGLAYASELYAQRVFGEIPGPPGSIGWTGPGDITELIYDARSFSADAYVHSNSWGSSSYGQYIDSDHEFDSVVRDAGDGNPMIITVSASNDGDDDDTGEIVFQSTGSPGNAKNVITVGASENYLPGWQDDDFYSDPDRTAIFSSRGWTEDNRVKPDVQAPGFWIVSTYNNADTGYGGMGGTSMSNPAVAGGAAVLTEWYEDNHGVRPSPAMVKALMINTAYDMEDRAEDFYTGPIPNRDEGWGLVNLPMVMDAPVDSILEDEDVILETGHIQEYEVEYIDPSEPMKISLVWTDAPAAPGANPTLRNNLDLEVLAPGGDWFRGNGFPTDGDGFSTYSFTLPNTVAMSTFDANSDGWDNRNNVENVYIQPGDLEAGTYTVRIHARNVPQPVNGDGQDYALVMYNAQPSDPVPGYHLTINAEVGGTTDPIPGNYFHPEDAEVTVEAIPNAGYLFLEWTGDFPVGEQNQESITITMDSDKTVTAHFQEITYDLTLNAEAGGTTDPVPGVHTYSENAEVTVEAIPNVGYEFLEWTGDFPVGEQNQMSITITMDADKTLTAHFSEVITYDLTLNAEAGGTTDPAPGVHTYNENAEVTVEAIPNLGYEFLEWTGDFPVGEQNQMSITITMDADKTLTAHFYEVIYNLTVNAETGGTTDPAPGLHEYSSGAVIPVEALPDSGWIFSHWTGDFFAGEVEDNPIEVTMDADKEITAHFQELVPPEPPTYLTVEHTGTEDGTETLYPTTEISAVNVAGDIEFLQFDPESAEAYDNWYEYTAIEDNELIVGLDVPSADPNGLQTVGILVRRTARSARIPELTLNLLQGGTLIDTLMFEVGITNTVGEVHYLEFDAADLIDPSGEGLVLHFIAPRTGGPAGERNVVEYGAVEWQANVSGTGEGTEHNLLTWGASPDEPDVVEYNIYRSQSEDEAGPYDLIDTVPADGSAEYSYIDEGRGIGEGGDEIFWWYIVHAVDIHEQECEGAGPVQEPKETPQFSLTINVEGEGTTDPVEGVHYYDYEEEVNVTAYPAVGWVFSHWSGDVESTEDQISVVMDENKTVTAHFVRDTFSLTINVEGEGTTDPVEGVHYYDYEEEVNVTAYPAVGWVFSHWSGDVESTEDQISVVMDENKTITAHFVEVLIPTMDIHLYAGGQAGGWNLVSFYLELDDTSLISILEHDDLGISGLYDRLMYYDASTGEWKTYVPDRPDHYNNLDQWDHTMGIWIRVTVDCTLTVQGETPVTTDITLYPGWNMVGLPSSESGNHGLPIEVTKLGYFESSEEYNIVYTDVVTTFIFHPGQGYWVYNSANEPVIWNVEYAP